LTFGGSIGGSLRFLVLTSRRPAAPLSPSSWSLLGTGHDLLEHPDPLFGDRRQRRRLRLVPAPSLG